MRCHNITDPEVGVVHIPGCMGCAVYGHRGCTCPAKPRRNDVEKRLDALEKQLSELTAKLSG
jgi:hypothetical protein